MAAAAAVTTETAGILVGEPGTDTTGGWLLWEVGHMALSYGAGTCTVHVYLGTGTHYCGLALPPVLCGPHPQRQPAQPPDTVSGDLCHPGADSQDVQAGP